MQRTEIYQLQYDVISHMIVINIIIVIDKI